MAQLGFRTIDEMIGRRDLLDMRQAIDHYKARGLDFSQDLPPARGRPRSVAVRKVIEQDHGLDRSLDVTDARPACCSRPWSAASRSSSSCRSATSTAPSARSSAAS